MRVNAGFGRRVANLDGSCVRVPCIDRTLSATDSDAPEDDVRSLDPLDLTGQTSAPESLHGEPGINTRGSKHEITYLLRAFGAWTPDFFTGAHGIIGRRTPADLGQAAGGMVPWDAPRRTLRSLPLVSWDAGTAIGPGQ